MAPKWPPLPLQRAGGTGKSRGSAANARPSGSAEWGTEAPVSPSRCRAEGGHSRWAGVVFLLHKSEKSEKVEPGEDARARTRPNLAGRQFELTSSGTSLFRHARGPSFSLSHALVASVSKASPHESFLGIGSTTAFGSPFGSHCLANYSLACWKRLYLSLSAP